MPAKFVAHIVVSPVTQAGNPIVTVPLDSATSISFEVPEKVMVPPKLIAVVLDPSDKVIEELAKYPLAIAVPFHVPLAMVPTVTRAESPLYPVASHRLNAGVASVPPNDKDMPP